MVLPVDQLTSTVPGETHKKTVSSATIQFFLALPKVRLRWFYDARGLFFPNRAALFLLMYPNSGQFTLRDEHVADEKVTRAPQIEIQH